MRYPHSWRASEYHQAQLADLLRWTGMSETTLIATLISEKHVKMRRGTHEMEQQITMTAERLAAMEDNDMALYWTPGSEAPYWASQPNFMYDVAVATALDFIAEEGYDDFDGLDDDETFTLTVKRPET
jgi:hypothetical protein